MKAKLITSVAILAILMITLLPMTTHAASTPNIVTGQMKNGFSVEPSKAVVDTSADPLPPSVTPFNLDMVDAEQVSETGNGIYVAVLDTGLLSNYQYLFPPGVVNIKAEWGIGFTHDIFYVGTGGNFSADGQFSYGPLRSDRGFITHDNGAPDQWGLGWGSGHGTQVTSEITGYYFTRSGVQYWVKGVAPKVTIIPVLVLDDWVGWINNDPNQGGYFFAGGTDEMVAAGIRYIGDLAQTQHIKIVISMSLGGPTPSDMIENAINYAIRRGVIIVAAAGNNGAAGMDWPGAYPQVISVAACGWTQEYLDYYLYPGDANDYYWWLNNVPENLWTTDPLGNKFQVYLTDFSGRPNATLGQHIWDLDVAAPGAAVKGPYKDYGPSQWGYYSVWGTSQATPHVSAIAALVLQDYPMLNQLQMEVVLKTAGLFNPLTKLCEKSRSALVYDIFSGTVLTYTWTWKDYGTGLLQADVALKVAHALFGRIRCPCRV
jgi:subtilisin family serine protease